MLRDIKEYSAGFLLEDNSIGNEKYLNKRGYLYNNRLTYSLKFTKSQGKNNLRC